MAKPVQPRGQAGADQVVALLQPKATVAPVTRTVGATTARSTQLDANTIYKLRCDVDCFYLQGTVTVDATTSSIRLPADAVDFIDVGPDNDVDGYVSVIRDSASGTLQLTPQ